MKYLCIYNAGEIEQNALTLIGASSKRGDNTKIGFFGSGNKYALAFLLRTGKLRIFSGEREFTIETKKESLRGVEFDVIYINGEKTSITTEMGPQWDLWQAIRELYSNAIDEGEPQLVIGDTMKVKGAGYTTIVYEPLVPSTLQEFAQNMDHYFLFQRTPICITPYGRIYEKNNQSTWGFFRKGIRVIPYDQNVRSAFDYDTDDININESRLISWNVDAYIKIWSMILSSNAFVLERALQHANFANYAEAEWESYYNVKPPSLEIQKHLKTLRIAPRGEVAGFSEEERSMFYVVHDALYAKLEPYLLPENTPFSRRKKSSKGSYEYIEPSRLSENTLKKTLEFLKECKFDIPYPFKWAKFGNIYTLAVAEVETQTIVLSDKAAERGVNDLAVTILEEYIHLKHGAKDESRAFQDASLREFVLYMKYINAYPL